MICGDGHLEKASIANHVGAKEFHLARLNEEPVKKWPWCCIEGLHVDLNNVARQRTTNHVAQLVEATVQVI